MSEKKRIKRTFRSVEGDWRRVDLHLHTLASADWLDPGVSWVQWLQKAEARGLDIVAITDHNTVEGVAGLRAEIERLAWLEANDRLRPQERRDLDEFRRLGERVLVLPGFEFTATLGFHVLAIFSPDTSLRLLELLLLRLNVPVDKLGAGMTEVGATTDVLTAYRLIDEAGGLVIAAHANSSHGVAMRGFNFGGQTKIAYTQDPHLHALEVTDLEESGRRSTARFFDGSKPEYPRRMHCIQGSDAHRLTRDPKDKNRQGIGDRVTEIRMPEVSFEALRAALTGNDFTATRPYRPTAAPFDYVQVAREQGNTIVQAFHETMPQPGRLGRLLADVVAFANTRGGTIYVGASAAKKGPPRGVDNPTEAIALLRREVEQSITPRLSVHFDAQSSQGSSVVRVSVPSGAEQPYALNQTRIFIRQEGETAEAARDEIVRLVRTVRGSTQPAAPTAPAPAVEAQPAAPVTEPAARVVVAPKVEAAPPPSETPKPARRRRRRSKPVVAEAKKPVQPEAEAPTATPKVQAEAAAQPAPPPVELPESPEVKPSDQATVSEASPPETEEAPAVSAELPGATETAGAVEPSEAAQPAKPARRRPRSRKITKRPDAAAQPEAAAPTSEGEPSPAVAAETLSVEQPVTEQSAPAPAAAAEPESQPNILEAPAIGVEIVAIEERKGRRYFTIRDLRNYGTVRNVTEASARKLWSYAINQYLHNTVDPERVTWSGDYGLWQSATRSRKLRYDLVRRQTDGSLRVFYGVTADGMSGPWAQFLRGKDRAEREEA